MSRAYRNVPLSRRDFNLLLMKAFHPVTNEVFYFVEKCLSFGSSISCAIFQDFSNAVAHLVKYRTRKNLVNYLDDYFFAAMMKMFCDWELQQFLNVCREICFPVSMEKTVWGKQILVFLGMMLNTVTQTISIPQDKIDKALDQISYFLDRKHKKTTVLRAQQLCGLLNFLCKCIVPGRAFTTRLYVLTGNPSLKQYHHVRISEENRLDLMVWDIFLRDQNSFCRPFIDVVSLDAVDVDMYSDASGNPVLGYGALCGASWLVGGWDTTFMRIHRPSIQFLELYAVTAGVLTWIKRFRNKKIYLFCDNKSVKDMINNQSSKCRNCMTLIRLITLEGLFNNVRIFAKHVTSRDNGLTDSLSRFDFKRFRELGEHMDGQSTAVPTELIPMSKVWCN